MTYYRISKTFHNKRIFELKIFGFWNLKDLESSIKDVDYISILMILALFFVYEFVKLLNYLKKETLQVRILAFWLEKKSKLVTFRSKNYHKSNQKTS